MKINQKWLIFWFYNSKKGSLSIVEVKKNYSSVSVNVKLVKFCEDNIEEIRNKNPPVQLYWEDFYFLFPYIYNPKNDNTNLTI